MTLYNDFTLNQQHSLQVEGNQLPLSLYPQAQLQAPLQAPLETPVNQGIINHDDIPAPPRLIRQTAINIEEYQDVVKKLTFNNDEDI